MAIQMTQAQKDAFAESIYQEIEITATPLTGTAITITNANIVQGSFSIDRSSVSGEEVEIGNVASAELIMALNNADGTFDNFTIEGATLDVGIRPLGVGSYVNIGRFIVDEVARHDTTINIIGLDYMVSLDGEMDRTIFQSDETVLTAIPKILTAVGITTTPVLDLANTTALFDPTLMNEGASYRDLLMCILEIGGANAYFLGDTLYAKWYGAVEATLDESNRTFGNMQGYAVEITGVEVVDGETTYLTGTKDYTISITNNPLITSGNVATILSGLNTRLVGFSYQPYRAETLPMPWLLPLDKVSYVKDTTPYTTVVTNTVFRLNSNLSIEGKGKSPLAKGYAKKAMTKQQENTMKALEDKIETEFAEVSNYFWHDADGAHVSDTPRATTGKNVLIDNDSFDIRDGTNVLATVTADTDTTGYVNGYFAVNDSTGDPLFAVGGGTRSSSTVTEYQSYMQNKDESVYTTYSRMDVPAASAQEVTLKERIGLIKTGDDQYAPATSSAKVVELYGGNDIKSLRISSSSGVSVGGSASVDWTGKITSALQEGHMFGITKLSFGETYTSAVSFWGNSYNKVGIAVTNTQENKQYGIVARSDHFAMYDYTDGDEVFRVSPPTLLKNGDNWGSSSSASISSRTSNTWTSVGGIELPAGTYLVVASADWSTNATGQRKISLNTTPNSSPSWGFVYLDYRNAVSGDYTTNRIVASVRLTATTTVYMNVWQNSGSTLTIYPRASVFKLA